MFKIAIDKNLINQMPVLSFPGKIYVIDSMLHVNAAIEVLRKHKVVGLDTETRPVFKKGMHHNMALMQLSSPDECFLFRINKIGIPAKLAEFLADETCLKVGLSLHDDFGMLRRVSDVQPAACIDIQNLVPKYHIADFGLQKVYAILFQKKISKGQQLTNWEAQTLTPAQQQYAAIDAWACIHIYNYLTGGHFVPEKSPFIIPETVAK